MIFYLLCYCFNEISLCLSPKELGTFDNDIINCMLKKGGECYTIFLGFLMGYSFFDIVTHFLLVVIDWNLQYLKIFYIINICIDIIVGSILGGCFYNIIFIFETSLIGAYLVLRAFAILFGGYIEDSELFDLIENGEYEQYKENKNGLIYFYFGLWVILSFTGI